jgi:hypothetical protein
MTQWAEPGKKFAEGLYVFRIEKEPEFITDRYFNKKKQAYLPMKKIVLSLTAMSEDAEFPIEERIPVWDDRYMDLLKALKIEHLVQGGADVEVAGKTFEAELKYQADEKRPGRSWAHIVNIKVPVEETGPGTRDDSDLPF